MDLNITFLLPDHRTLDVTIDENTTGYEALSLLVENEKLEKGQEFHLAAENGTLFNMKQTFRQNGVSDADVLKIVKSVTEQQVHRVNKNQQRLEDQLRRLSPFCRYQGGRSISFSVINIRPDRLHLKASLHENYEFTIELSIDLTSVDIRTLKYTKGYIPSLYIATKDLLMGSFVISTATVITRYFLTSQTYMDRSKSKSSLFPS